MSELSPGLKAEVMVKLLLQDLRVDFACRRVQQSVQEGALIRYARTKRWSDAESEQIDPD